MHIQLLGVRAKPDDALWFQRIYASVVSHNNMTFRSEDQSQLQLPLINGGGDIGYPLATRGSTAIKTSSSIIIII
jgi:hypothetical protein